MSARAAAVARVLVRAYGRDFDTDDIAKRAVRAADRADVGRRKLRTITTEEELDALPDGSAVINNKGNLCELFTVEFPGEDPAKVYAVPGIAEDWPIGRLELPATVLYEPKSA